MFGTFKLEKLVFLGNYHYYLILPTRLYYTVAVIFVLSSDRNDVLRYSMVTFGYTTVYILVHHTCKGYFKFILTSDLWHLGGSDWIALSWEDICWSHSGDLDVGVGWNHCGVGGFSRGWSGVQLRGGVIGAIPWNVTGK